MRTSAESLKQGRGKEEETKKVREWTSQTAGGRQEHLTTKKRITTESQSDGLWMGEKKKTKLSHWFLN